MKRIILFLALAAVGFGSVATAQTLKRLTAPQIEPDAYINYIDAQCDAHLAAREEAWRLASVDAGSMRAYLDDKQRRYLSLLGDMPERTPLNAEVTGIIDCGDYTIEKVVFQSVPRRYVTGVLCKPAKAKGKVPVVLIACGHTNDGKYSYLQAAVNLAANGVAGFIVDPIGQGERVNFIDGDSRNQTRGATTEHGLLTVGGYLIGEPLVKKIWWDNTRALDYLQSRKDIDGEHIGMFGTSGAGTQTMMLMGVDSRIKAAAVSSAVAWGFYGTGGDGCSILPNIVREQVTMTDIAMLMAPRPLMFLNGKNDYIDVKEGRMAYAQLKLVYGLFGAAEGTVSMIEPDCGHELFVPEKQNALVTFFRQHLLGKGTSRNIGLPRHTLKERDIWCTPTGNVLTSYADARSTMDEWMEDYEARKEARAQFISSDAVIVRSKVLDLLGIELPKSKIHIEPTATYEEQGLKISYFRIHREGEVTVPCALVEPEGASADADLAIWLYEGGKNDIITSDMHMNMIRKNRQPTLLADVRGMGETAQPFFIKGNFKSWNRNFKPAINCFALGRSLVGQRVVDVVSILDFCIQHSATAGRKIEITADGDYITVLMHAALLDKRISVVKAYRGLKSWRSCIEYPMRKDMVQDVVFGVTDWYDVNDLRRLVRHVRVID